MRVHTRPSSPLCPYCAPCNWPGRCRYGALRLISVAADDSRVPGITAPDWVDDPAAWPGAIDPWLAEAREHGWIPAVLGASEEAGTVYTGTAWTRWSWVTRRSWRGPTSRCTSGLSLDSMRR